MNDLNDLAEAVESLGVYVTDPVAIGMLENCANELRQRENDKIALAGLDPRTLADLIDVGNRIIHFGLDVAMRIDGRKVPRLNNSDLFIVRSVRGVWTAKLTPYGVRMAKLAGVEL